MSEPTHSRKSLQAIALFEATKGSLMLLVMIGLMSLLHHDVRQIVHNIIGHYGFEDTEHFPSLIEHWTDVFYDTNKLQLFALALAYVCVRFSEAYGLWHDRAWGEWLTALSGGIYLPFEALHMWHKPSISSALVLLFNAMMVAYLAWQLWLRQQRAAHSMP